MIIKKIGLLALIMSLSLSLQTNCSEESKKGVEGAASATASSELIRSIQNMANAMNALVKGDAEEATTILANFLKTKKVVTIPANLFYSASGELARSIGYIESAMMALGKEHPREAANILIDFWEILKATDLLSATNRNLSATEKKEIFETFRKTLEAAKSDEATDDDVAQVIKTRVSELL